MRDEINGFTLIELIVVIAILAILAAIAIPRFISQTTNARIAAMTGLAGAIHSAVALAQAQYIADGNSSTSTTNSIFMNGVQIIVEPGTGRPTSQNDGNGIAKALASISGFSATYSGGIATFNFSTTITNCNVTYEATTGNIITTTDGC